MKIHELLTESISLTPIKPLAKQSIQRAIINACDHLDLMEDSVTPEIKSNVNSTTSLKPLVPLAIKLVSSQLEGRIAVGLENAIQQYLKIDSIVGFSKIGSSGYNYKKNIYINIVILNKLSEMIVDYIVNKSSSPTVESFFEESNNVGSDIFAYKSVDIIISNIISIFIHELVHVVQFDRQLKAGRSSAEYRSYLSKSKEKFGTAVDRLQSKPLGSVSPTDPDYKLYKASPQEMAAFAHETALQIINDNQLDTVTDLDAVSNDLDSYIPGYIDNMFSDPANAQEYKVYKRFSKQVYLEVVRYIDYLKHKNK